MRSQHDGLLLGAPSCHGSYRARGKPFSSGSEAVALLLLAILTLRERRPTYRRGRFLSVNEKHFLVASDEAVGEGYRVFVQVRLAADFRSRRANKNAAGLSRPARETTRSPHVRGRLALL